MTMTRWSLVAAAALIAGCSTPVDHFHTLRPLQLAGSATGPSSSREAPQLLAIGPVTVPAELARDEWVIRTGDTGAMVYDHQLWTQDLSADVAQSLADYLNCAPLPNGIVPEQCPLPEAMWADAGPTGSGNGADLQRPASLRVRIQVLRFDSILSPSPAVRDQVRWVLECLPSDATPGTVDAGRYRIVRTGVRDSTADAAPTFFASAEESQRRFDRVASAHSETLRRVAVDVAVAWQQSRAERAQVCVAGR